MSLLLTFLVISDNENCLRFATARKCKHLLLQKKRRQRWEGLASLNISPSLESPPLRALTPSGFARTCISNTHRGKRLCHPCTVPVISLKSFDLSAKPIFPEGKAYWIYDNAQFASYSSIYQQQERGFLRGEDVEVKENAACSLFPERDPLSLKRRFFCNFSCRRGQEKLVLNRQIICNLSPQK